MALKRISLLAFAGLALSQGASAEQDSAQEQRAAFRQAVFEYQMFVVPHCAPDDVQAYVNARGERDRAFVRSLRRNGLEADYNRGVADRAERDKHTVYECMAPPPPPPPPPGWVLPKPTAQPPRNSLAEHFKAGDKQFAVMERLRDTLVNRPRGR